MLALAKSGNQVGKVKETNEATVPLTFFTIEYISVNDERTIFFPVTYYFSLLLFFKYLFCFCIGQVLLAYLATLKQKIAILKKNLKSPFSDREFSPAL